MILSLSTSDEHELAPHTQSATESIYNRHTTKLGLGFKLETSCISHTIGVVSAQSLMYATSSNSITQSNCGSNLLHYLNFAVKHVMRVKWAKISPQLAWSANTSHIFAKINLQNLNHGCEGRRIEDRKHEM